MLNISLPDPVEARLVSEAQRHGVDASRYASQLLEHALAASSVDDILKSFREQVSDSGLSDDQLDAVFQKARQEAWQNRGNSRP